MKRLKHILIGIALLTAMLPCAHAMEHHDHGHDSALELCALDAHPCECHSCDHPPCPADIKIQIDRTSVSDSLGILPRTARRLPLPEYKPVLKKSPPPVIGILAAIQTIQLLI